MDATGIRGDPEKTSAIDKVPRPNNVLELRQFMGMLNQLGKFSINYSGCSIIRPPDYKTIKCRYRC